MGYAPESQVRTRLANPRAPVYGELGAPGLRDASHAIAERRSFASRSSARDLRHGWGGFDLDKAGLEIEIGFGDFDVRRKVGVRLRLRYSHYVQRNDEIERTLRTPAGQRVDTGR